MGSKASRVKKPSSSSLGNLTNESKQSYPKSTPKDANIQKDGVDPHYLSNLKLMGQVNIPKQNVNFSSTSPMIAVFRGRSKDSSIADALENEPSTQLGTIAPNRISSALLAVILDDRKKALAVNTTQSTEAQQQFLKSRGVEPALMNRLAKHVNSVSVHKEEVIKTEDHREIYTARWIDVEHQKPQIPQSSPSSS